MYKYIIIILSLSLNLIACGTVNSDKKEAIVQEEFIEDPHSYSNISEIRTEHLDLELDVNFDNKTIYGVARHKMSASPNVQKAVFDIKALDIQKVTLSDGKGKEVPANFSIGPEDELMGQPLTVDLKKGYRQVNIYYQTTELTEAIDWLPASLTSSGKFPFMYTQGQAILTRSWIPLQDSPGNRITYSADVKVPEGLMAVMSASNPTAVSADGRYHYDMKQRIPAYLIAIAVGELVYTPLGNNCGTYSEPSLAKACAYEFADLPKMITAAEELYGEYLWDRYDLVVLPYSFPFGGMENPRLTFANPTVIAGDRSSVSVIAHELAHSWSGNLVTNATWNDFWLNEGFTVYFENRIMEKIYGPEVAEILRVIEYQELQPTLDYIEESDHPEDSRLKLQLEKRNPDDAMNEVAYIKGAFFLRTIEEKVGRAKFDTFLKQYFADYKFKSLSTEGFLAYLNEHLFKPNKLTFDTEEWIYRPGLPEACIIPHSKRLEQMSFLAEQLQAGEDIFDTELKGVKRTDRTVQEWQSFIRAFKEDVDPKILALVDDHLDFSHSGNRSIMSEWFTLAIQSGYSEVKPETKEHLIKIGRRWLIEGIYRACKDSDNPDDLKWAQSVFNEAKDHYHFVSRSTIEEILF